MSRVTLPANWKPCEVNQAPSLNQYQINTECSELSNSFWSFDFSEEEDQANMSHVGLYKFLPKLMSLYKYNQLTYNWKSFI
jgi:hypothetical protein